MEQLGLLIVEDDRFILRDLETMVDWAAEGFVVFTAANGRQGVTRFGECGPALVISDVRMPFMDGIEMFHAIREKDPLVQCLFLSAYDDYGFVREGLRSGAWDYILKSDMTPELILKKAGEMKQRYQSLAGARATAAEPEAVSLLHRAMDYLRGHYAETELKNADVARGVGVSERKLSELFRQERNQTLNDYLTELRMEAAKRLLEQSDLRVYEIAEQVGYGSSAYFSTAFTRYSGKSPADYRKELKK